MSKLDVIDMLDGEDGFVRLVLNNGDIEFGAPVTIFYNEDEQGWETVKRILFEPFYGSHTKDYGLEDIAYFDPINEEDIPPYE